ncbi:hypothetical protein SD457_12530 [Coprobacillaceae bacterium CR2/5/TPMF4]|nr:hypothetical protein SD457_12530 [Coprobacillaceae bacterium CR2/5/TPMF4]
MEKETKITSDVKNEVVEIKDEAGNVTGTEEKDYPAVGKYTVNVTYKDDKYKQSAEVKDTTAPAVTLKDNAEYIQINTGTDLNTFDFASMIVVEDLSEITKTNIDFSQVNSGAVGNYPIAVTAEDKYGNTDTTNVYAIVADAGTDITALVEEVQEQKATDEKKKAEEKKKVLKLHQSLTIVQIQIKITHQIKMIMEIAEVPETIVIQVILVTAEIPEIRVEILEEAANLNIHIHGRP